MGGLPASGVQAGWGLGLVQTPGLSLLSVCTCLTVRPDGYFSQMQTSWIYLVSLARNEDTGADTADALSPALTRGTLTSPSWVIRNHRPAQRRPWGPPLQHRAAAEALPL